LAAEELKIVDMKLEVVTLPVSDVDRAKRFYQSLGFRLDIAYIASENFRVMQLTPRGSECSIIMGKGITSAVPGSAQGLHLIVFDIEVSRAELVGRSVNVAEGWREARSRLPASFDWILPSEHRSCRAGRRQLSGP
jgi:hypothetical protein